MKKDTFKRPDMKQISIAVSVIVFTILMVSVIIIINFTKGEMRSDVLKQTTNVGVLLLGSADDHSWNQSHIDSLDRVSGELNLKVIVRDNVPPYGGCHDVIRKLIEEDDCKVVIATSVEYGDTISQAAKEYPDCRFLYTAGRSHEPNVGSFFGRMYQIRYLSGIIAGNQTKTGHIGYVGAYPNSEVNRCINAFTLGVRAVRPDAVVHVSFCNSWVDDELAASSANMLIDKCGADVITLHTDSVSPLRVAEERSVWSIGTGPDDPQLYPNTCLTSCVWDWDSYYRKAILSVKQGKFRGEWQWLGYESGIMKLTDPKLTGNAAPGYEEKLNAAIKGFEEHTYDVFYGPVTDMDGRIRIPEGESMSDDEMYDRFDWYVEGVKIEARVKR